MSRAPKGVGWASALSTLAVVALFLSIAVPGVGPSGISPVLFGGCGIVAVAALVVALAMVAIWGRPAAQATFHIVVSLGLMGLAGVRLARPAKIGVNYVLTADGALVTEIKGGPLEQAGLRPPLIISSVDNVKVGVDRADLAGLVAKRKPFDAVTLDLWFPNLTPKRLKIMLGD